jgi:prefoldin subunit 5
MLLEHNELLKRAYTELKEEITRKIESLEQEINALSTLKLKSRISEDTLYFLGKDFDSSGLELKIVVPENVDNQLEMLKSKLWRYERFLRTLESTSKRYGC